MLSLTAHAQIPTSNICVACFNSRLSPVLIFVSNSNKFLNFSFQLNEERRALKSGINLDRSWCCGSHQGDGEVELEAEIMNFMAKSEKPSMFPTKEELVRAGRFDLVRAIKKRGGWYSLGWDDKNAEETTDSDIAEFHRRIESCNQSASSSFFGDGIVNPSSQLPGSSLLETSQQLAADVDSGIDGILSRLEKQRNNEYSGIKLGEDGYEAQTKSEDEGNDMHSDTPLGFSKFFLAGGKDHEENIRPRPAYNISHYTEPETWRSWLDRRAGFPLTEFEEISFEKNPADTNKESYHDGITVTTKEYAEDMDEHKEINYNEIQTRLQDLESELTTALRSIRSEREDSISKEVTGGSTDLQSLSDAVEFQENEVMSAKQRLRSLRAKLAVVEGKMTLARIEAQKIIEVKKRRIGDARRSLQLLRTTSIVWPNSAAEVSLVGSFDGWTTQRRMRRSKSGMFSITLKLYPGRYEIKFIVDGKWKLDPLRPIVNNNGHENNLFIVT
ncbi:protein PTST homolog 2, chloroplastic-like isoform X2 [Salvia splendens]|uniref:protein PTST homolog 2, chloroplastic-like isoform X2 n=1 Tax=Salvia splendens TaxID=180675 RepID=UPI001C276D97|nr:protein PTST homolog 2, chloroplastic-like isoform X2 [Salvia splendens]